MYVRSVPALVVHQVWTTLGTGDVTALTTVGRTGVRPVAFCGKAGTERGRARQRRGEISVAIALDAQRACCLIRLVISVTWL